MTCKEAVAQIISTFICLSISLALNIILIFQVIDIKNISKEMVCIMKGEYVHR